MKTLVAAIGLSVLGWGSANAEKAPVSKENLEKMATHVVVGEVVGVYSKVEANPKYRVTRYVAEVKVDAVEKGKGIVGGDLVYVRYWTQKWIGKGLPEPGTSGHYPTPKERAAVRVYLVNAGYDGFGKTSDGGYTVFGGNGFELLKK